MILVTVGLHNQGFDRLIRKMDEIAVDASDKVVMQIGSTSYEPQNCEYFRYTSGKHLNSLLEDGCIVVSHAGAGSIITALSHGAKVIVVPRLKRFGECVDDHQTELAEALLKEGKVLPVYDIDELEEVISKANTKPVELIRDDRLVSALRRYIAQFEAGKAKR